MKRLIILFTVFLVSCQGSEINHKYPENPDIARKQRAGKFFGDITLNKKENKAQAE